MAVYGDLTKTQQDEFAHIMIVHYLEVRRLVKRHESVPSQDDKNAIQAAIDIKVAAEPTVDSYLGL